MRSTHRIFFILLILSAMSYGCGDGKVHFEPVEDAGTLDTFDPLAGYDISEDSGPIPLRMEVALSPARAPYGIGQKVRPEATVVDVWGESYPITTDPTAPPPAGETFEVVWTVHPTDAAADAGEGRYELLAEGPITFRGCTVTHGLDGAPVCGEAIAVVNDGAPSLALTSPQPGAMLGPDDGATITVAGNASDTYGTVRVYVNGEEAVVDGSGGFLHQVTPQFGINHIEVVATDGVYPKEQTVELDVLWAEHYAPTAETGLANASAPSGVVLRLGQRFFDDGVPVSQDPEQAIVASDLADIVELLVENLDLMGQLPDPIVDTAALVLRVTDIQPGLPLAELDVTDNGLELYLMLPDVSIQTAGTLDLDGQTLSLNGTVNAALSGVVVMELYRVDATSPFVARIVSSELAIEDVTGQFDDTQANAVFALAESALRATIEDLLTDQLLRPALDALPAVVLDIFNALDGALADQSFPLSTGVGPDIQLAFDAGVESLTSSYREAFLAVMGAEVSTDAPPLRPEAPGIPLPTVSPVAPFIGTRPTQIGVDLQLLNGLGYVLWQSALLDLDLSEQVGPGSSVSGLLPPVFRAARPDEPYDVVLSIGQLEATMSNGSITFGLFLEAGINITLTDGVLALVVAEEPAVKVWTISGTSPIFTESTFESIVTTNMWPMLFGAMDESLSFALPSPDLSAVASLAPALSGMKLRFDLGAPIVVRDGFALIDVAVSVVVP